MQYSQEHLKTIVYAKFGGQTECIMGNWKIENTGRLRPASVYKRVEITLVEVFKRVEKSVISVGKRPKRPNSCVLRE